MAQEQRKTALGTARTARQGHSRGEQLNKSTCGHDGEEIDVVVPKRKHQEIRNQVEKRKLEHGDDDGEHHGREVPGGKLELLGERVDLVVHKTTPVLDLRLGYAHALEQIDNPVRKARNHLGHERHGKDAQEDEAVTAEAEDAQDGDVAVMLGKIRHARKKQNGAPGHQAELVHDKARELRGTGLAHVLPRLGETIDLRRG